jgi:hypothetical protein
VFSFVLRVAGVRGEFRLGGSERIISILHLSRNAEASRSRELGIRVGRVA